MCVVLCFFFFKQKTAYEMRISDWSSDVCSSDLLSPTLDRASPSSIASAKDRVPAAGGPRPPFPTLPSLHRTQDDAAAAGRHQHMIGTCDQIGRASCRERVCQYV